MNNINGKLSSVIMEHPLEREIENKRRYMFFTIEVEDGQPVLPSLSQVY
jgi:hypothetical protein